jgi:peptide/nickel transport system permease protein
VKLGANTFVGGVLIALLAGTAITATFWTPFDPLRTSLRERLKPPSAPTSSAGTC